MYRLYIRSISVTPAVSSILGVDPGTSYVQSFNTEKEAKAFVNSLAEVVARVSDTTIAISYTIETTVDAGSIIV